MGERGSGAWQLCAVSVGALLVFGSGCAGGADGGVSDGASFGPGGGPNGQSTEGDGVTGGVLTGGGAGPGPDSATGFVTSGAAGSSTSNGDPGADCIDEDGDGYGEGCNAGPDCNDGDVEINPGQTERCDDIDWNCDDDLQSGCDCPDDGVGSNCNLPYDLGVLDMGGSGMGVVGNVPLESTFDWYQVSFPITARPGTGTPTISFSINEGDAFVFDVVYEACGAGGMPCGNAGAPEGVAEGLTDWTFVDDDPGCCTEPMDSLVQWPDQVYIRVYRTTPGTSCAAYQLQVSR